MINIQTSGFEDEKEEFEADNMTRLYFLPAEPWGPVCSPGCWTPWSSRLHYRAQLLRNWSRKKEIKLRKYSSNSSRVKYFYLGDLCFTCEAAYMSGEMKLSWSMRTSRLVFTAALYMGIFLWMEAWRSHMTI